MNTKKNKRNNSKSGFTLIELLVVVAIIGLLSSVVLASLNSARAKARDARRLADAHQFKIIMQLYYSSNGDFPNGSYYTSGSGASSWSTFETLVGQKLHTDPIGVAPGATPNYPYYEYYKLWPIGSAGPGNCYGRTILRMVPGMESRPQIHECDEQYGGDGVSVFLIE
ncbi:MAG: hypothetical protein A2756_04495 [Candidatus Ryanbacteria bacterium RIFCSPHIGHO2_01_FULL_48_27]|uniref:Type II secretion system protein GspG C-terminal domain-containing protein n=1 Tax=Candidatus Ryanbacteria bacterium RIFCSPHIGHO2_01_FULL_48_27 TaxID=1802115 RepID=A0A1G2G718_9BACT|nr:MAG: hypothetical protein A2756_04495 [Candidatus Ryanbacteria bacterium RIFCSPHIGHO2_01_FULL_48_27]